MSEKVMWGFSMILLIVLLLLLPLMLFSSDSVGLVRALERRSTASR